jgi:hypothetical protein
LADTQPGVNLRSRGIFVVGKFNLLLQAERLLRLSRSAADPELAAALVRRAAALMAEAASLEERDPMASDVRAEQN